MDSTDKEPIPSSSTGPHIAFAWKSTQDDELVPVKMSTDNVTEMTIKQVKKDSAYTDSLPAQFSGSMIKKFGHSSSGGSKKNIAEGHTVYCASIGEYVQVKKREEQGEQGKVISLKCKVVKVVEEGSGAEGL